MDCYANSNGKGRQTPLGKNRARFAMVIPDSPNNYFFKDKNWIRWKMRLPRRQFPLPEGQLLSEERWRQSWDPVAERLGLSLCSCHLRRAAPAGVGGGGWGPLLFTACPSSLPSTGNLSILSSWERLFMPGLQKTIFSDEMKMEVSKAFCFFAKIFH